MAHPYKIQADDTHRTKRGTMGKDNNLVVPMMKAIGENSIQKKIHQSSASQQLREQSAHSGMKRGGHVGKNRHKAKVKLAMVAPAGDAANPPSPDPALAAAGAGASPAPAPSMPMPPPGAGMPPPAKRGGRIMEGPDEKPTKLHSSKASEGPREKRSKLESSGASEGPHEKRSKLEVKYARGGRTDEQGWAHHQDGMGVMNKWQTAGRGSGPGGMQTIKATTRHSGMKAKPVNASDDG